MNRSTIYSEYITMPLRKPENFNGWLILAVILVYSLLCSVFKTVLILIIKSPSYYIKYAKISLQFKNVLIMLDSFFFIKDLLHNKASA